MVCALCGGSFPLHSRRGSGEHRELLSGVWGGAPVTYAFLAYFWITDRLWQKENATLSAGTGLEGVAADPQTEIFGHQWGGPRSSSSSGRGWLNPAILPTPRQIEHYVGGLTVWVQ